MFIHKYWGPEEIRRKAELDASNAECAEALLSKYKTNDVITIFTCNQGTVCLELPDKWSVEQCWDFVNWVEDEFGVDYAENRPRHDTKDKWTYYIKYNGIDWRIENCKEHCKVIYVDEEVPEQFIEAHVIEAHVETKTKIVCADNNELVIA